MPLDCQNTAEHSAPTNLHLIPAPSAEAAIKANKMVGTIRKDQEGLKRALIWTAQNFEAFMSSVIFSSGLHTSEGVREGTEQGNQNEGEGRQVP